MFYRWCSVELLQSVSECPDSDCCCVDVYVFVLFMKEDHVIDNGIRKWRKDKKEKWK